ncbi:MAG: hypothetical protein ACI88A_000890 [Paraglaciecola sp.]|jgi:hypothetical protein
MQIDKLAISTQPRSSWKAFDLGCKMAILWWRPLLGFWLISSLPFFILVNLISMEYGMLLLWLFKPWFERGLLFILSRQVFGEQVSVVQALKVWPQQIKPLWFSSITWRRLSTTRAFDLPVAQLEGLSGSKRVSRLKILHQTSDDNSSWWLIICVHWELFIVLGLAAGVTMLTPQGLEFNLLDDLWAMNDSFYLLYNVFLYIAWAFVAPLYVGGCFAAYLNRRVVLEGWDIELSFKQLGASKLKGLNAIVGCLFVLGLLIQPTEVGALEQQTNQQQSIENVVVNQSEINAENELTKSEDGQELEPVPEQHLEIQNGLSEIFSQAPFGQKEVVKDWRWTGWKWDYKPEKTDDVDLSAWTSFLVWLAKFASFILWLTFGLIILSLLWLTRHQIVRLFEYRRPVKKDLVLPSFSRSSNTQTLKKDIPAELERLLETQSYRQVLSLLLVSSLTSLVLKNNLSLTESMTEKECLRAIEQSVSGQTLDFMAGLFRVWIGLAWAHQWPEDSVVKYLHQQWQQLFLADLVEASE